MNVERMKEEAKNLGCEIEFNPDEDLKGFHKGRPLTVKEFKAIAEEDGIVWVQYTDHVSQELAVNGPWRANGPADGFIGLEDGSCWTMDFEIKTADDDLAVYEDIEGGVKKIFEAVKE